MVYNLKLLLLFLLYYLFLLIFSFLYFRDTTVQTLTVQPTVVQGVVRYEDSPLVKAAKLGRVLVVDEADKAPTHVTCILKVFVNI